MIMISHDLSVLAETCRTDGGHVRRADRRDRRVARHDRVAAAPVHPGALVRAFPRIGDPASRLAPAGLPGDPPDPSQVGDACPFEPRCPQAYAECTTHPVQLWDAGPGRRSACLRVLPDQPPLAEPTGPNDVRVGQ